jgi:hypothetical protein
MPDTVTREERARLRDAASRAQKAEAAIAEMSAGRSLEELLYDNHYANEREDLVDIRMEFRAAASPATVLRLLAAEVAGTGALVAHARREAMEEAARIARDACLSPPDGGSPTEGEVAVADNAAAMIRARALAVAP